jgi:hypothetical protein
MYEKLTKAQKVAMELGFKLRVIGAIQGNIGYANNCFTREGIDTFTEQERQTIEAICDQARARARNTYNTQRSLLTPSAGHRA